MYLLFLATEYIHTHGCGWGSYKLGGPTFFLRHSSVYRIRIHTYMYNGYNKIGGGGGHLPRSLDVLQLTVKYSDHNREAAGSPFQPGHYIARCSGSPVPRGPCAVPVLSRNMFCMSVTQGWVTFSSYGSPWRDRLGCPSNGPTEN